MTQLNNLIQAMLFILPALSALRALICAVKIQQDDDDAYKYKSRLRNMLAFTAIAECALGLIMIIWKNIT